MTPFNNTRNERAASFPNLNYNEMRKICSDKPSSIARKYGLTEYDTKDGKAWFKDNGSSVLAVAHVDSCHPFTHFSLAKMKSDTWIFSPTLDDRLGVYVILDWLEKAKIKVDILLTDNEEKGNSTARSFNFPHRRQYNWMFMFDRSGTDVATYQYGDIITKAALDKHGFIQSYGAYSCIVELDDLNCKGFNFGTGYYNPHSNGPHAYTYASRIQLVESLHKFSRFFGEYRDTHFPHKDETSYLVDKFQSELPFTKYDEAGVHAPIFDIKTKKLLSQGKEYSGQVTKGSEDKRVENASIIARKAIEIQKKTKTELLYQDITLLPLDDSVVGKLHNNGIDIIIELVQMRGSEIINLEDISFYDLGAIKKALAAVGLELWTTASQLQREYGILKTIEVSSKGTITRYNFTTLNNFEIDIHNSKGDSIYKVEPEENKEEVKVIIPEIIEDRQIIQLKPLEPQEIINVQYLPVLATENAETEQSDKQVHGKGQIKESVADLNKKLREANLWIPGCKYLTLDKKRALLNARTDEDMKIIYDEIEKKRSTIKVSGVVGAIKKVGLKLIKEAPTKEATAGPILTSTEEHYQAHDKGQSIIILPLERWTNDGYELDADAGNLQWRKKTKQVGFTLTS